jgi:hypothetical protein
MSTAMSSTRCGTADANVPQHAGECICYRKAGLIVLKEVGGVRPG